MGEDSEKTQDVPGDVGDVGGKEDFDAEVVGRKGRFRVGVGGSGGEFWVHSKTFMGP
jgi:hypothetical protein